MGMKEEKTNPCKKINVRNNETGRYLYACWRGVEFAGYHIHFWVPRWLLPFGWLLGRLITVTVEEEDPGIERAKGTHHSQTNC